MNINKFTIKSQEALQGAVALARRSGNQAIEPVHLLSSLLSVESSPLPFLLGKLGIAPRRLEELLGAEISALPKVSGGGRAQMLTTHSGRETPYSFSPATRHPQG